MKLGEAKTYKDYYAVVKIDDTMRHFVRTCDGYYNTTKLGCMDEKEILVFEKKKDAKEYIEKHTYKGMSSKYEIVKLENTKETAYRWAVA